MIGIKLSTKSIILNLKLIMENKTPSVIEDVKVKVESIDDQSEMTEMVNDEKPTGAETKKVVTMKSTKTEDSVNSSPNYDCSCRQRWRSRQSKKRRRENKPWGNEVAPFRKKRQDLRDKLTLWRTRGFALKNQDRSRGRPSGVDWYTEKRITVTNLRPQFNATCFEVVISIFEH